jgi:hypothetical protein
MDKFIKALRFVLGKQHESAINDDAESSRRYHILMGRLYQQLSDLTLEHPLEMFKCMQVRVICVRPACTLHAITCLHAYLCAAEQRIGSNVPDW